MKKLKIGIASLEEQKRRTISLAAGARSRGPGEPHIWFASLKAAAEVLDRNKELLRLMVEEHPDSIQELARLSGRASGNLSRSLKRLEACGIVKMEKVGRKRRPVARACEFEIAMSCLG